MTRSLCRASAAVCALLSCTNDLSVPDGAKISCEGNPDCPQGLVCRPAVHLCVPANSLSDDDPPGLSNPSVAPTTARAGVEVRATFDVSEPLLETPRVSLDVPGRTMTLESSSGSLTFLYRVRGDEPQRAIAVSATLVDRAGNRVDGLAVGSFIIDLDPPQPLFSAVSYQPPPGSPLPIITEVGVGATIHVTVVATELLDTAYVPTLEAANGAGGTLRFDLEKLTQGGATFVATVPPGLPDAPPTYRLYVAGWADRAGNVLADAGELDRQVEVRTTRPVLQVDQGRVMLQRSPWGSTAAETLDGGFRVLAGPHFALAPLEPLSGDLQLPADVFRLENGAPLALVRVWATDAGVGLMGGLAPDGDGGWPRSRLVDIDVPAAYVTGLDRAGNESHAVLIRNVEWVASPAPSPAHPNPHRLVLTEVSEPGLAVPGLPSAPAGLAAFGSDGAAEVARATVSWKRRWLGIPPAGSPVAARAGHAVAFDAARGRVVLFGGLAANRLNDTWEWDGTHWIDVTPNFGPSPRKDHAMAYDTARARVVLFGGDDGTPQADLWEWDGTSWSKRPNAGPAPRARHALAYDSLRRRLVLVGGVLASGADAADTWEWDGEVWLDRTPAITRPRRSGHAMAFDPVRGRSVLFGGTDNGQFLGDTWEWDGAAWARLLTSPPSRNGHGMTWDPVRQRVLMFGGAYLGSLASLRNDLWEWDGVAWTQRMPVVPTRLTARRDHSFVYDAARNRAVVFGGQTAILALVSDTWLWDGASWAAIEGPAARHRHAMVYDESHARTFVFGGRAGLPDDDAWEWDGVGWLERARASPSTPWPPAREGHVMAYDPSGLVVLFGGGNTPTRYQDTWEWNGAAWANRTDAGTARPPANVEYAIAYDRARSRGVLFGGDAASGPITWEWTGQQWFDVTPDGGGRPPVRTGHALAFDEVRSRTVLFGGAASLSADLSDTWEWDGAAWQLLTPDAGPSARHNHGMAYDPLHRRVVVAGGVMDAGNEAADVWEWDGQRWSTNGVLPFARPYIQLSHDVGRQQLVAFGGYPSQPSLPADLWERDQAASRHPAATFTVSLAEAAPLAALTSVHVRARCGANGFDADAGTAVPGAALAYWSTGDVAGPGGAWVVLATNTEAVGASAPELPGAGALLETTLSGPAVRRLIQERDRALSLQCVPIGASGPRAGSDATLAIDSIEARVRYVAP